jgi:hypothetical protein
MDGELSSVVAPSGEESTGLLALSATVDCESNPCDPECRAFAAPPDAGLPEELIGFSGGFPWETGSLGSLPPALVDLAFNEPCSTGFDCQFNSYCEAPISGECSHSKCAVGESLAQTCDLCVIEICATSPECCESAEQASCAHRKCSEGSPLKASCDPCVAQVCEAFPYCCDNDGIWDDGCVAEVYNTCGETCSCCDGEVPHNGHCYNVETGDRNYQDSRTACQQRGAGWDIVSIRDSAENTVVTDMVVGENTWIGISDANGIGFYHNWQWPDAATPGVWNQDTRSGMWANFYRKPWPCNPSSDPHGCTATTEPDEPEDCVRIIKSTGYWYGKECDQLYDVLCEGPQLCGADGSGADPTYECEGTPAEACAHDPCEVGVTLKSDCDQCVADVCAVDSDCCAVGDPSKAWDEECAALVPDVCAPVTCECGPGQVAHGGHCYKYDSSFRSWTNARNYCLGQGATWDIVSIGSSAENAFVDDIATASDTWIGITEGNGFGWNNNWVWANGDPSGSWVESSRTGLYHNFYTQPFGCGFCVASEPNPGEACARMLSDGTWWGKPCIDPYAVVCEGIGSTISELQPIDGAGELVCEEIAPAEGDDDEPPVAEGGAENAWTDACVDKVATVCDAQCVPGQEISSGLCVPWYPGQTDETCLGIDLAVGVPCDGTIPVCNHGTETAPAGIKIAHLPQGSGEFSSCTPDLTGATECVTDRAIPAGQCISVEDCGLGAASREIVVNPPGADQVAECSCKDNWSLYVDGVTCGPPSCSGGTNVATMRTRPIDIIIGIDNSASMQSEITAVQRRINDDLAQIIQNAGIDFRVIMVARYGNVHIWRHGGGNDYTSAYSICIGEPLSSLDCPVDGSDSTPAVQNTPPLFYHHSSDIGSRDLFCKLTDSYDAPDAIPARGGWTSVAPNGWGEFLREEALKVFVGITDDGAGLNAGGTLGQCATSTGFSDDLAGAQAFDRALRTLAPDQFGAYDSSDPDADRNYRWYSIVGMAGNDKYNPTPLEPADSIQTLCCQGDGDAVACPNNSAGAPLTDGARSGQAYQQLSRMTGGLRYPICYHSNFDDIFNAIAAEVVESAQVSCDFELHNVESSDVESAELLFREDDDSAAVAFTKVDTLADCGTNNWYIPDGNPANGATLCPDACTTVQGSKAGRLTLEVGCLRGTGEPLEPFAFGEAYEGQCGFDESVQWSYFSLDVTTPDDSEVVVRARTAASEAELEDAEYYELGTFSTANGNTNCAAPVVEGCPVSLFEALGGIPDALNPFLEFDITLNPNSDGTQMPSIDDWGLTYSCRSSM